MVIYLPQQSDSETPLLDELTPREIVAELDKYVIGQAEAKRSVAIALRNRVRRQKLDPEMAEEVMPKNILMIGPTGVGKPKSPAGSPGSPIPPSSKWKPVSSPRWAMSAAMSSPSFGIW